MMRHVAKKHRVECTYLVRDANASNHSTWLKIVMSTETITINLFLDIYLLVPPYLASIEDY